MANNISNNDWMLAKLNARNEKLNEEIKRLKLDIESERNNIREIQTVHKAELMAVSVFFSDAEKRHDRSP